MNRERLNEVLDRLPSVAAGVVGDFCLDSYWTMDPSVSEMSLETGLSTRPVSKQRYSLGGAGNVVANLAEMGVGQIRVFGVVGDDPFGAEMRRLLEKRRTDLNGLLVERRNWATPVYIKPLFGEQEQHRIDFGNVNALPDEKGVQSVLALGSRLAILHFHCALRDTSPPSTSIRKSLAMIKDNRNQHPLSTQMKNGETRPLHRPACSRAQEPMNPARYRCRRQA